MSEKKSNIFWHVTLKKCTIPDLGLADIKLNIYKQSLLNLSIVL